MGIGRVREVRLARVMLEQMRTRQWTKNVFVFLPIIFAKQLGDLSELLRSVAAFVCISLAASGTYILNDLMDLPEDRKHPTKRRRPIASGRLPVPLAREMIAVLLSTAALIAIALGPWTVAVLAVYVGVTVSYSARLKQVPLVELFMVASGFVIRVLLGSAATHIPSSPWLLLTALFLALLLAFGKRRGEIGKLGDDAPDRRRVLEFYGLPFLDRSITLLAGCTLLCYAIYCTADVTVKKMGTEWLVATAPFVAFGVLRYLYVIEHGDHAADSPSDLLLTDRQIQVAILLWLLTAVGLIYTH